MQKAGTMMTSSNENIFRVTGHLCGEFTGHWWEFPAQTPATRSFDVFFDLRLNKRLSKQWWGWWFETPSHPLWRHYSDKGFGRPWIYIYIYIYMVHRVTVWSSTYYDGEATYTSDSLQWHHNERDGVSYHRRLDCLFNSLFRRQENIKGQWKHQSSASLVLVMGIISDHWISLTKGQ